MTNYSTETDKHNTPISRPSWQRVFTLGSPVIRLLILGIIPLLYLLTLAQTPVLGDPAEYTVVSHVLGVAHPPGYALITVLGKLFQTLIPVGTIAWRMHALAATIGSLGAIFVYGSVQKLTAGSAQDQSGLGIVAALFAALTIGTAADHWQHSIHANPHIITAAFTAANLFYLTAWWRDQQTNPSRQRWLYIFSLSTGIGVTQHPLTVFGFPAYALFILVVWWRTADSAVNSTPEAARRFPAQLQILIKNRWRTLLRMLLLALVGLSVWLYFPLRSPVAPLGATGLNSLSGFLDHILARGLTENLPFYGLADFPNRLTVFWSILRLQYGLVVIFLALFGLLYALWARRAPLPRLPVLLYALTFATFWGFVINLRVQDIMAYLLGPLLLIGLFAGLGLWQLLLLFRARVRLDGWTMALFASAFFLLGPGLQGVRNFPRISLRAYDEGERHVAAVFEWFGGKGEEATLLNDWEHMTPLWYAQFVDGRWPAESDVHLTWVGAGLENPWLEAVFQHLPGGPVYLTSYRREIVDAGFRLRARGPFYQVMEPGDASLPPELTPVQANGGEIEIVGVSLPETAVAAGDYVPLTLAMRAPATPTDFYVPVVQVGMDAAVIEYTFTTDSHLLTPWWQADEVVVERFDIALPHDLPGGDYPVSIQLKNLTKDSLIPLGLTVGTLAVTAGEGPVHSDGLLANFRQRVGLVQATARGGDGRRVAPWDEPIHAQPGDAVNLTLTWRSLDYAEESYTIFLHLIDLGNQPLVTLDYTPLGGSTPTHLWFPKWLPGQQMRDPYRLEIPADLPPGQYLIEVGLYEMVTQRRLHMADAGGNLVGDRYILGSVLVGE